MKTASSAVQPPNRNFRFTAFPHFRFFTSSFFASPSRLRVFALFALYQSSPALAEEARLDSPQAQRVRILGKIADGSPAAPALPPVVPRFIIKQSFTKESQGSAATSPQATFHEVVDPQLPALELPITARTMSQEEWDVYRQSPQFAALQEKIANRKKMQIIMLSAMIYDDRLTHLRWWYKDRMHEAWSNVNFLYLGGFPSFVRDDQEFVLIMASGKMSTAAMKKGAEKIGRQAPILDIPVLPDGPETNPAFTLVGEMPPEEAIAPITALHELYAQEHTQLKAAHEGRVKVELAKAEELQRNPPQPQVPQIYFWRGQRDEVSTPSSK